MTIITGHQPVYLPWLGLFHKISLADTFVFMDDVQYLEQDWNNRNRIKGPHGPFWLTVPVRLNASPSRRLADILIDAGGWPSARHWQRLHWRSLESCYRAAPYWRDHAAFLESCYLAKPWTRLAELNEHQLRYFIGALGLDVEIVRATDRGFVGHKSELVLDHCRKLHADVCVMGAHGREYAREADFQREGVRLYYQDYRHPEYPQRFGPFVSHLSIVDLLCQCGPKSRELLESGNITKAELLAAASQQPTPGVVTLGILSEQSHGALVDGA